ncbi:MAG: cell division protein FtsZ, partial [Planctomycetota bacterium]|nr:cell division protein FtsZ [Planctomycetota bacterium]
SDLITVPGEINLDFADVRTVMAGMGMALMGTGVSEGDHRSVEAAQKAISSPLLEDATIHGARGVLINVTGGEDMTLHEVSEAADIVQEAADPEANIIFGTVIDRALQGKIKVTVIATGFSGSSQRPYISDPATRAFAVDGVGSTPESSEKPVILQGSRPQRAFDLEENEPEPVEEGMLPNFSGGTKGDLDVPAFLRKQMD